MIWPRFIDVEDAPIPNDVPLMGTQRAVFTILTDELKPYHQNRLSEGLAFYCVEGAHVVTTGKVTKLLALAT